MGLDWIKISCDLPRKRQVHVLCRRLKIRTVDEAIGMLLRFWAYCEHESDAGRVPHVTPADVDLLIGKKGFAEAMVAVGWLAFDPDGASVPAFDRFMGAASRARDQDAERKRRQREAGATASAAGRPSAGASVDPGAEPAGETVRVEGGPAPDTTGTAAGHGRDGGVTGPGPKIEMEMEMESQSQMETFHTHHTHPEPPATGGEKPGVWGEQTRSGISPEPKPQASNPSEPKPQAPNPSGPKPQALNPSGPRPQPPSPPRPKPTVNPSEPPPRGPSPPAPPTFEEFRAAWNAIRDLPRVEYVSPELPHVFHTRCKQQLFRDRWRDALDIVRRSPRCLGATGWRADMRWFLKSGTLEDLLNGVYDEIGRHRGSSREEDDDAVIRAELARRAAARANAQPSAEAELCAR